MKIKKKSNQYDPNLIWACSVDLREEPDQLRQVKLDTEIQTENILPRNSELDSDNPEQTEIN